MSIGNYFRRSVTVSLSTLYAASHLTLVAGNMGNSSISLIVHGYVRRYRKHGRLGSTEKLMLGFAVIFARLSDGIGRLAAVIIAYVLFAGFSLGGGLAQTLDQLIALRVLQGIGGSGLYSMLMVIGPEITPLQYRATLSGMIGMVLAIGLVLGISSISCPLSLRNWTTLI